MPKKSRKGAHTRECSESSSTPWGDPSLLEVKSIHQLVTDECREFREARAAGRVDIFWLPRIMDLVDKIDLWFGGKVLLPGRSIRSNERRFNAYMDKMERVHKLLLECEDCVRDIESKRSLNQPMDTNVPAEVPPKEEALLLFISKECCRKVGIPFRFEDRIPWAEEQLNRQWKPGWNWFR
jgi:hypothetical protein